MTNRTRTRFLALAAAALLPLGACDNLLDVESPGRIADEDLNDPEAILGIIAGMSGDLTEAFDDILQTISVSAGELHHGGSYDLSEIPRGVIRPEDVDGEWEEMQQARWVAENGLERIQGVLEDAGRGASFNTSPLVARGFLLAGLANRTLGENVCSTVIDGGEEQPHTIHFQRAEEQFTRAIQIGQAAKNVEVVEAAFGGRASVRAWQGNWAGAVEDAKQVNPAIVYYAIFNTSDLRNDLAYETHNRPEYTVANTIFERHSNDPRIPWDTIFDRAGQIARGANGQDLFFQQNKYVTEGDDVPVVKGTEMLVLRAEAALRDNDIAQAFALLNEARAVYNMAPLPAPSSIREAWTTLHFERSATNWLEARRFWDLRRWHAAGEGSPMFHAFLEGRDKCIPISEEERKANPNLQG
jgi:hypothetical protein